MTIELASPRLTSIGLFPGKKVRIERIKGKLIQLVSDDYSINIVLDIEEFNKIKMTR